MDTVVKGLVSGISETLSKPKRCLMRPCPAAGAVTGAAFPRWLLSCRHRSRREGRWPRAGGLTSRRLSFQQGGESDGFFHPEGQPQRLPQPPEVRQQPVRKVTLTKGALQQPQHLPVGAHMHPAGPPGIKSIQGLHPAKKVRLSPSPHPGRAAKLGLDDAQ